MPKKYLIMKNGLYYGPNNQGYTGVKDDAGRYTYDEACRVVGPRLEIDIIAEDSAADYSPNCFRDVREEHRVVKGREDAMEALRELLDAVREARSDAKRKRLGRLPDAMKRAQEVLDA